MKIATRVVAEAFAKADPENAAVYEKNSAAYLASLDVLERWIRVKLAALPHERRKLVTSHDALGYLAHDYGFTVYPIKGVSTGDEPSSKHVRELVRLIREQGVKAVFFESMENPRAMDQISLETGVKSGGILYADALGAEEASTYDSMMRHNMTVIVEGLR
jgi:zinc/manganese transport system substrate-binding protein